MTYLWQVAPSFLALIGCVIWAINEIQIEIALRKSGVNADAKITKLEKTSWGRTIYFRLEFEYYVDDPGLIGGRYTKGQIIGMSHFYRLIEGSQVTIHYLPTKPFVAQLTGKNADHASRDTAILAVGLISIILILLVSGVFSR